jgi:hypothetical protein
MLNTVTPQPLPPPPVCNEQNGLLRGVANLVAYYYLNAFAIWPDKRGFSYKGLLYANQKISFRLITPLPLFQTFNLFLLDFYLIRHSLISNLRKKLKSSDDQKFISAAPPPPTLSN